jgi:3-dehydroquinate dehydratase
VSPIAIAVVCGFGWRGYLLGLEGLLAHLRDRVAAKP